MSFHRTIVVPDVHVPLHHQKSVRALLDFTKFFKPNRFIQLGDFCDLNSLSSYDLYYPEEFAYLEDELGEANSMLDMIEGILPSNCEKFLIGGNHEARWHRARVKSEFTTDRMSRSIMKLKDTWADEYHLNERGWSWCEYGGYFELGKIVYTHGWDIGKSNSAQRTAARFPGKNIIYGHTHRHQVSGGLDHNQLPVESETIGTLSRFDLSYLRGKPAIDWVHGFMVIFTRKDDTFTKTFTNIIDGRFIAEGKDWGERRVGKGQEYTGPDRRFADGTN